MQSDQQQRSSTHAQLERDADGIPTGTNATRKLRFRESGNTTVTEYGFTLMKKIRDNQPSRISPQSNEARKI